MSRFLFILRWFWSGQDIRDEASRAARFRILKSRETPEYVSGHVVQRIMRRWADAEAERLRAKIHRA